MESGLGSTDGDVEADGRIAEREADVVDEHDDARCSIARRSSAWRIRSRSARAVTASPGAVGSWSRMVCTSTRLRRLSRRDAAKQARTVKRRSQASHASGTRSAPMFRQASTSASWTASWARSRSRRMRLAMAYCCDVAASTRLEKAALSPAIARSTISRCIPPPIVTRLVRPRSPIQEGTQASTVPDGRSATPAGRAVQWRAGERRSSAALSCRP